MTRPRITTRRPSALLLLLAALLLPLFVPIPVPLQQHPIISPLADRTHVVLFAALTLVLYHRGPLRGRLAASAAAALAIGGASEVVQILAGRSASLWDWYQDAQGIALAACWVWWRRSRSPRGPAVAAAVVAASILWPMRDLPTVVREQDAAGRLFPLLSDFERPRADLLWRTHRGAELRRIERDGGGHALQIDHDGDDPWPGAKSSRLAWRWTGQDTLLLDARLVAPSPDSLAVTVWMEDRRTARDHGEASRTFRLGHRWTTLRVPLADLTTIGSHRPVALSTITDVGVLIQRRGHEGPVSLQVDDLRLRPGGQQSGSTSTP